MRAIREIELARLSIWSDEFAAVDEATRELLIEDVLHLFDESPNKRSALRQTLPRLQTLPGEHWSRFFSEVRRVLIHCSDFASLNTGSLELEAWAVGSWRESPPALATTHTHNPALLSGVYYLRIPPSVSGGTYFEIPQLGNFFGHGEPGVLVDPREGSAVVFPGWLPHASSFIAQSPDEERLVIAFNAYYVPRHG